jgi:hypothetical protein
VENVVKYVKQNFLYNRTFRDLETLNDEAHDWLFRTANALAHGTTKKAPLEEHYLERGCLNPWYPIAVQKPGYATHTVRKDNAISWKGNLYSVPLGTYKGPGTQVLIQTTATEIIIMGQDKVELFRHQLSPLKGQKILSTNHTRDHQHAIAELMEEFSGLMENKQAALEWVAQIRDHKPRYIRDQILSLKTTVLSLEQKTATAALDYCINHQIISAADFKAVAEKFKQELVTALPQAKIIQLNPLSGDTQQRANMDPQKSDLGVYDNLFGNS